MLSWRQVFGLPSSLNRPEQRQRNDDAGRGGVGELDMSILSPLDNIAPSLQYCPNPFIHWRIRLIPRRYASFFLGAFNAGTHSLAKRSDFGGTWHSRSSQRIGQFDATELRNEEQIKRCKRGGSPVRTDNWRKKVRRWNQ